MNKPATVAIRAEAAKIVEVLKDGAQF